VSGLKYMMLWNVTRICGLSGLCMRHAAVRCMLNLSHSL
jgi:hypothetical protein